MSGPAAPDLHRRSVPLLSTQLADGTISARQLLDHYLARIASINPALNAFVHIDPQAVAQADACDVLLKAGRARGPLEGIPVAIKDNLWVEGMPAVWGSPLFAGFTAPCDEYTVARLRSGGAILLGKTNCPEFAMRGVTDNAVFGATANPHHLRLTPGGSSGGAVAAVAAGLVPLALATDGGGSIRRPSAHTGLVGLKPSVGRVPRGGGFIQLMADFEVIGPIARDVDGARMLLRQISRPVPQMSFPDSLRILFVETMGDAPVEPEILESCRMAAAQLARLGHAVFQGPLPFSVDTINAIWADIGAVGLARLARDHTDFFDAAGTDFAEQARAGTAISAADYAAKMELVLDFRVAVAAAFDSFDVIMTPATAAQPWPLRRPFPESIAGRAVGPRGHAVFTGWVNAAGVPAVATPAEPDATGMPIGFQLVGRAGADDMLLDLAETFLAANGVDRWPSMSRISRRS